MVLLMVMSEEIQLDWIINFGGSYYMMPKLVYLFDFEEFNDGTVLLGDDKPCVIKGI